MRVSVIFSLLVSGIWAFQAGADTAEAQCEIYPAGSDRVETMTPCTFSQRQGHITITRQDGVDHDLMPVGDMPGNFEDPQGNPVYRQSGLADAGTIFRFPDFSLFVYWGHGDQTSDADNPTAPFSTDDYDATALLNCGATGAELTAGCPAGVMRMEDGQASVTVLDGAGNQFTMNFMKDVTTGDPYVNATNRNADAALQDDIWQVIIDDSQVYQVPVAFLQGG
ncbi:hypothetical protein PAF17_10870 [Paracoccus sp. Z330]|uniref:Secreted protein n=1 Tax=Paracoccus onchidii TaxID=3017813 RepID=A0ABT4ZF45_9RHOB|nr:hypothetical protein [Paracoccus onchidii]MDB6178004.1 hypothetical protein [Paracoccus onchidii]